MVLVDIDITDKGDGNTYKFLSGYDTTGYLLSPTYIAYDYVTTTINIENIYQRNYNATQMNHKLEDFQRRGFFIFEGITIPQGSTINDATLTFDAYQASGLVQGTVLARKTASPVTYTATGSVGYGAEDPLRGTGNFTKPVATATNTFTVPTTATTNNHITKALDIKTMVQELVDAFDYNNDNMMFTIKAQDNPPKPPVTTTPTFNYNKRFYLIPNESGTATTNLTINYTAGAPLPSGGFTVDPETGKITFGVVSDGTNDATARDIASEFGVSETFNDDFNTDAWDDTGTRVAVNTSTQVIDWDAVRDSTNQSTSFDLGSGNVNDEKWTYRFKVVVDSVSTPSVNNQSIYFAVDSVDHSVNANSASHTVCLLRGIRFSGGASEWGLHSINNGTYGGTESDFTHTLVAETLYIELKRTSATDLECSFFSDATYTTLIENITSTIPANVTNLRYLVVKNWNGDTSTGGSLDGTFDDVQFWDGVTQPSISETEWRLRYKLNITNIDNGSTTVDKKLHVGLFDSDETLSSLDNQDGLFTAFKTDSGADDIFINSVDGADPNTEPRDATFATAFTTQEYFMELKRLSETSYESSIYPDSSYTTPTETETGTITSGITELRYLKVMNDEVTGAGAIDGTIDDITFLNSVPVGAPTETFDVDAILDVGLTVQTKDFTINATLSALVEFTIDAFLLETQTFNFTVDGLLFITPSRLICVDVFLQDTFDEDFTIDARLSALEEFEVDARLVNRFDKDFTVEAFAQATFDEDYAVDGILIVRKTTTFDVDGILIVRKTTTFDIDARIVRQIKFDIDAIIRYAQGAGVGEFGAIPDLIIRVLRENGTLTGRGIVDEIVIITTNENFPFRGKTSRIKNWLNRLKLDGLIQEDGSSPDWYKTIWSLV